MTAAAEYIYRCIINRSTPRGKSSDAPAIIIQNEREMTVSEKKRGMEEKKVRTVNNSCARDRLVTIGNKCHTQRKGGMNIEGIAMGFLLLCFGGCSGLINEDVGTASASG